MALILQRNGDDFVFKFSIQQPDQLSLLPSFSEQKETECEILDSSWIVLSSVDGSHLKPK
jgi:hypothetical protein